MAQTKTQTDDEAPDPPKRRAWKRGGAVAEFLFARSERMMDEQAQFSTPGQFAWQGLRPPLAFGEKDFVCEGR